MPITLGLTTNQGADGGKRRRDDPALARVLRMLERLGNWVAPRADRLTDIYLVRIGNSVALYLIARDETRDFGLGRELAGFAGPFIARGVINAATLLPASSPEELEAFFDRKRAFRVTFA